MKTHVFTSNVARGSGRGSCGGHGGATTPPGGAIGGANSQEWRSHGKHQNPRWGIRVAREPRGGGAPNRWGGEARAADGTSSATHGGSQGGRSRPGKLGGGGGDAESRERERSRGERKGNERRETLTRGAHESVTKGLSPRGFDQFFDQRKF